MSKLFFDTKRKSKAQAMVEFALVLPVLLLVIYGILETGRLLFIYASTVTAARQAARYGSATGLNDDGTPYYQDCPGIRTSANKLGFINRFTEINIAYDGGVADSNGDGFIDEPGEIVPITSPIANPSCGEYVEAQNGDRITVEVVSQWQPIVPLVPLRPFEIRSSSERTILASIDIFVDAEPPDFESTGGTAQLTLTGEVVGNEIHYTYIIKNIGLDTLDGPFSVNGTQGSVTCDPTPPVSLPPEGTFQCTGVYPLTATDFNNGYVANQGSVTPSSAASTKTLVLQLPQNAQMALTVTPDKLTSLIDVTYTYRLENTGNVTIYNPRITDIVSIAGNAEGLICEGGSAINASGTLPLTLAPGEAIECQKYHSISQPERDAGLITNNATATASYNKYEGLNESGSPVSVPTVIQDNATAEVITTPIYIKVVGELLPGSAPYTSQQIAYTFSVRNNNDSSVTLTSIALDSFSGYGAPPVISCGMPISIAPGVLKTCTVAYYSVTETDLNNLSAAGTGLPITIKATATASGFTSSTQLYSVDLFRQPALSITAATTPSLVETAGEPVDYVYTIKNDGNVTLTPPVGGFEVSDTEISGVISCENPTTSIPAGGTKKCYAAREILQEDIDHGVVVGDVSVSAFFGAAAYTATTKSVVSTYNGPRLLLDAETPDSVVAGSGVVITYTYTLTNAGNIALTTTADADPYDFKNYKGTIPQSCGDTTLDIGESTTCTGTYTTKTTDLGNYVTNAAYATAYTSPGGVAQDSNAINVAVFVASPDYCNVNHGTFTVAPTFQMPIVNNNEFEVQVSTVHIIFNDDPSKQEITEVQLGGNTIWSGSGEATDGDVTLSAGGLNTIPPASVYNLTVTHWSTHPTVDDEYTPASPAIELMEVTFTNGSCTILRSDTIVPEPESDLRADKTDKTLTADIGGALTYVIRATNGGPDAVTNAKLQDSAASGLKKTSVACSEEPGNKCVGTPTKTQLEGSGIGLPTLGSGDFYEILVYVDVTETTPGALVTNVAVVNKPMGVNDPDGTNNTAQDIDTVAYPSANVRISKVDESGATEADSGGTINYIITVTNDGPSAVKSLKLLDLPVSGLNKVIGAITCTAYPDNACGSPPSVAALQAGTTLPILASGAVYQIRVPTTVTKSDGTVTNTAKLFPPSTLQNNDTSDDSSSYSHTVIPSVDLGITKTNSLPVYAGGTVTYTIHVTNNRADVTAGQVILTDPEAADMTKTAIFCTGAAGNLCNDANKPDPGELETGFALPAMASTKFYELTVTANVTASSGSITNAASVSLASGLPDDDPTNDDDSVTDTVIPAADLAVVKSATEMTVSPFTPIDAINAGKTLYYRLTVTNNGPSAANGAKLTDPGVSDFSATSVTCGSASGGAVCPDGLTPAGLVSGITIATLPSGGSMVFTVTGTYSATITPMPSSKMNTATVSHATVADSDTGNNNSPYTLTVNSICYNGLLAIGATPAVPITDSSSPYSQSWTVTNSTGSSLTMTMTGFKITWSASNSAAATTVKFNANTSAASRTKPYTLTGLNWTINNGANTLTISNGKAFTISKIEIYVQQTGCNVTKP